MRSRAAAYCILAIGLLSTGLLCQQLLRQLTLREKARFAEASGAARQATQVHLRSYVGLMAALRGLFLANPNLTQQQWHNFFKSFSLSEAFPGLLDVALVLRVPGAETKKHVLSMRQKGLPNYRLFPDTDQKEHFPVAYFQSASAHAGSEHVGWDGASALVHRAAMMQARDSGQAVATGKIRLTTGEPAAKTDGFLLYLPIYAGEETPATLGERNASLRGFVAGTYLPEKLWADVIGYGHAPIIDLDIYEGTEMNDQSILYDTDPLSHRKPKYSDHLQVTTFGRTWTLSFSSAPAFDLDSKRYLVFWALASGVVISFLLFGIAWTQAQSRAASDALGVELGRSEDSLRHMNEQLHLKILESQRAQEELQLAHYSARSEQERLSVTLRSIGEAVLTTDIAGRIVLVNQAAEALTGWGLAEAFERPLDAVFPLRHRQTRNSIQSGLQQALESGDTVTTAQDCLLLARNGELKSIFVTAAPIRSHNGHIVGAVLVARDMTELERLEAELLRVRKLESVALLASGLAHDFNTLLTGILGNVSVARMFAPVQSAFEERLAHAEKSCLRAKELTERLLSFAQSGPPRGRAVRVTDLLKDTAHLATASSPCQIAFSCPADLWPVQIEEGQICQVIYDLVTNAIEVMPDGGKIDLTMQNIVLGMDSTIALAPGRYVQITLSDEGPGIPPEHLPKIFDPYFTTKRKGSGLGLATAYFILQRHHGLILAHSSVGNGTTFHLYLPAAPKPLPALPEPLPALPGLQGRILLMDDELLILNLGAVVLKRLGYEVTLARDGEQAVQLYQDAQATGQPFAAVILDLVVQGGMSGQETMKRLLALDPAVTAIVSSGYWNDPVMSDYKEFGFAGAITKPYHGSDLAKLLSKLLATRRNA